MPVSSPDRLTADTVLCPTCRAEQPWSDTCRRCKCDLSLLHAVWQSCQQTRHRCLQHLRAGHFIEALDEAHQYHATSANADAAQLLAVCHLLNDNWSSALTTSRVIGS